MVEAGMLSTAIHGQQRAAILSWCLLCDNSMCSSALFSFCYHTAHRELASEDTVWYDGEVNWKWKFYRHQSLSVFSSKLKWYAWVHFVHWVHSLYCTIFFLLHNWWSQHYGLVHVCPTFPLSMTQQWLAWWVLWECSMDFDLPIPLLSLLNYSQIEMGKRINQKT